VQRQELARHLLTDGARGISFVDREVALEQIDHWQIRARLPVRQRSGLKDEPAGHAGRVRDLPPAPRLAHPGLPARRHHRPVRGGPCGGAPPPPAERSTPPGAAAGRPARGGPTPGTSPPPTGASSPCAATGPSAGPSTQPPATWRVPPVG